LSTQVVPTAVVALTAGAQRLACSSVADLISSLHHVSTTPEHLMDLHLALAYCETRGEKTKVQRLKAAIASFLYQKGLEHGSRLKKKLKATTTLARGGAR
jgi:hypothetical protein